ncbi:hypothetical protein DAEQUDRAFT_385710 [Daedalea quercina L-15889]|uniref:GYF domain-containing protein n=1 Tax=Daedalea quercina L-15889 TaxID=1314783 RepID=A0A165P251_9APHY|nr:hypothetical protein DAEQUDRAFT_385710 [Daedalea quercina L-15889]
MTTTTMHFGPEWMRTKGSTRPAPEPPLPAAAPAGTSTYSALVTPTTNPPPDRRDVSNPFRYAKEEMLRIYKEGGGRGGLGLEVERWDGIVREVGAEPVGLKEMSESEKKLFAGSLNSEIRRRQSTDVLSPLAISLGERPKLGHAATAAGSPMRERMSNLMSRRRDSTDQQPLGLGLPRKLSLSSMQSGTLASPRDAALPSPRARIGGTPGFEGVLGESWSSRRRGDSLSKPGAESGPRRDREPTDPGKLKGADIKEEDEDMAPRAEQGGSAEPDSRVAQPEALDTNGTDKGATAEAVDNVNDGVASLNLGGRERETNPDSPGTEQPGAPPVSKPPGLTDVSSVEWSYLDPQGNIQGPFRADIMQRWHNEGYFNPDLLMKRTHLDTEWTSVGEMVRRAGANPIFLTSGVTTSAPPGLSRWPDVLVDGPSLDRNSPLQPIPTVSRRGSTLDSYLHNGSSASASPSSSFGGSRYQNGSPDLSSFDGRPGTNLFGEPTVGPRLATLASMPSIPNQRRSTFNDPFDSSAGLRPSLSHAGLGRGLDNHGLNGINGFGSGATPQLGQYTPGFDGRNADLGTMGLGMLGNNAGLAALRGAQDMSLGNADPAPMQDLGIPTTTSRIAHRDMYGKPAEDARPSPFGIAPLSTGDVPYSPSVQSTSQAQPVPYSTSHDNRSLHSLTHTPLLERPPIAPMSSFSGNHQLQGTFVSSPVRAAAAPQWPPQPSPISRRPGPFDPDYPTASNTIITGMSTGSPMPYGRSMQNIPLNDQSPWGTTAQQGRPMNGWSKDTSSLTVENLGQHNQQQQEIPSQPCLVTADIGPRAEVPVTAPETVPIVEANASVVPPGPLEPTRASQKTRRKSTAAQAVAPSPTVPKAVATPPAPIKPPSPAPAPCVSAIAPVSDPKAPWATDDEAKKAKPSGATLGLREIQEAEMKKLEARKAAERERERAARAAAGTSQAEDFQPFTTSWGLPTSQAGAARSAAAAAAKDTVTSPVPSATTPATTPVWTNTAKTPGAKKTMKEIQEEEERRKKLAAKEKETVAAAAKRANTTTKPASPAVQTTGGAWTTVGSGGKTAVATTPTVIRPVVTATASARVVPPASSPAVAVVSASVRAAPTAPSPRPAVTTKSSSKADDFPTPPSQDFMKWMGESLKGLNSSVNFEEITSMLLSFPLDPDPSTVEIISDLIYASSTTLDGRRFAAEFVSRRKADAATRAKSGTPAGSSTKGVSIADVVKAQPKPAQQSEWGGFKVVNKKKKGGRA